MSVHTGWAATLVAAANRHHAPVLSLDGPSELDTDTGVPHEPAILAGATVTLALPKTGLIASAAAEHAGELFFADIIADIIVPLPCTLPRPSPWAPYSRGAT